MKRSNDDAPPGRVIHEISRTCGGSSELIEAADWYDLRQPLLGDQLLAEVDAVLAAIRENPYSLPQVEKYAGKLDLRRLLLRRFPYIVYVLFAGDEVVVAAIAHTRGRPLYWLNREK